MLLDLEPTIDNCAERRIFPRQLHALRQVPLAPALRVPDRNDLGVGFGFEYFGDGAWILAREVAYLGQRAVTENVPAMRVFVVLQLAKDFAVFAFLPLFCQERVTETVLRRLQISGQLWFILSQPHLFGDIDAVLRPGIFRCLVANRVAP